MASSGIVYASVNEWYSQVGIRQALSGQLNEKFYVNIYIDARRNLKLVQPLWNSPVRADFSIKYKGGANTPFTLIEVSINDAQENNVNAVSKINVADLNKVLTPWDDIEY